MSEETDIIYALSMQSLRREDKLAQCQTVIRELVERCGIIEESHKIQKIQDEQERLKCYGINLNYILPKLRECLK